MPQRRTTNTFPSTIVIAGSDAELERFRKLYEAGDWTAPLYALNYFMQKSGRLPPLWLGAAIPEAYKKLSKRGRGAQATAAKSLRAGEQLASQIAEIRSKNPKLSLTAAIRVYLRDNDKPTGPEHVYTCVVVSRDFRIKT